MSPPIRRARTDELLIVDDVALEASVVRRDRGVPQIIVERSGRAPTVMPSNRDTAECLSTFDEMLVALSAVHRFIHIAAPLTGEPPSGMK